MVWVAVILVGTSWPELTLGADTAGLDKVAHFSAYAILAALSLRATRSPRSWPVLCAVVASIATLGAVDEWHQSFIPGRSMSLPDWFADTAGALVGTLAVRYLPVLTPRRP